MTMTDTFDTRMREAAFPLAAPFVRARTPAPDVRALDPLDQDGTDDDVVITTRRGICRVALVAAEAAGRFEREGLRYDPMSWVLAPRELFGGAAALDACLDRDECLRGVLIHSLSLGLDMDPAELDELASDDGVDDDFGGSAGREASTGEDGGAYAPSFSPVGTRAASGRAGDAASATDARIDSRRTVAGDRVGPAGGTDDAFPGAQRAGVRVNGVRAHLVAGRDVAGGEASREDPASPRLFTATVVARDGAGIIQAFHASLAVDEDEISGRLRARMGATAEEATIVAGIDAGAPLVTALVAPAVIDALEMVAADPGSPLGAGLHLFVEQRFLG